MKRVLILIIVISVVMTSCVQSNNEEYNELVENLPDYDMDDNTEKQSDVEKGQETLGKDELELDAHGMAYVDQLIGGPFYRVADDEAFNLAREETVSRLFDNTIDLFDKSVVLYEEEF